MIPELRARFTSLRPSLKSLILLYWINAFTNALVGVFLQIYLYEKFTDVSLNLVANIILYLGIMVGFVVPGIVASMFKLNIKYGFVGSFVVAALSLFSMLYITSTATAYLAMFFWGVGQGLFWLTVNTFELSETKDSERDFYSSVLSSGVQILAFLGPAIATVLLWLSGSILHVGTFTLLFAVAPVVYLLGFFCFANLQTYRPPSITGADLKHFFTDRQNQFAQLFTLGQGFEHILGTTILPLVFLFILGTALNVGVFDTLLAVVSAICVLIVARYRTPSNRLLVYGIATVGSALLTLVLGFALTFTMLVLYLLLHSLIAPVRNVSAHVISLHAMEIGRKETDFFATMIFREVVLTACRVLGGLFLLLLLAFVGAQTEGALSIGLYVLAGSFVLTYFGGALMVRASTPTTR